jgi:hypothetical protein
MQCGGRALHQRLGAIHHEAPLSPLGYVSHEQILRAVIPSAQFYSVLELF